MLDRSNVFKLDGVALYSPSKCSCQVMPVHHEDSGTDENEDMHLIVKGFRRKVTLTFDLISGKELGEMLKLMIKKVNYYQLQYKDVLLGINTIEVYIPDYVMETLNYAITTTEDNGLYQGISIEFIGRKLTDY